MRSRKVVPLLLLISISIVTTIYADEITGKADNDTVNSIVYDVKSPMPDGELSVESPASEDSSIPSTAIDTERNNLPVKDSNSVPDYALDYSQFGLETPNYDEKAIMGKIQKKGTQIVEGEVAIVKYAAIIFGLVAALLVVIGVVTRGFKLVITGAIGIGIELVIYAVVGKWSLLYEAFSSYFWS